MPIIIKFLRFSLRVMSRNFVDFCGGLLLTAAMVYSSLYTVLPKYPTFPLIALQCLILGLGEYGPFSTFMSRKLVHSLSGLVMCHLEMNNPYARYFVYAVGVLSLAMTWNFIPGKIGLKFRFSSTHDLGITLYLATVTAFFWYRMPIELLKPLFFADPMGAVIGSALTKVGAFNPKWVGKKSVGGSLAVLVSTYVTLIFGGSTKKLAISTIVALVEGLSGDYDNLFITIVILAVAGFEKVF